MTSFTGKFSSVRGWALLLALLLGAGMMISACGEEEVPAPTTPTPAPTPAPAPEPEPEPTGPATPANLRVTAVTHNSITWTWDAVEGALGYEGQFSTDSTFTNVAPPFIIIAPNTSQTVSNLSGNMTGYFRVRSGTGTSLTALTYSDWSAGVSGMTGDPPPAVPLSAPSGLDASDATENTVSLSWDRVSNAGTYEVQQVGPGEDAEWGAASCDGGRNVVDDTECVASGLTAGTDYDFRVRAIPSDTVRYETGGWSSTAQARTDGTAPAQPTTPVTGGTGGGLNLQWSSTDTTITWTWDRISGKTYDYVILSGTAAPRMDSATPCADQTYPDASSDVADTNADYTTESPALLCVRTRNPNDRSENLSYAWGVYAPAATDIAAPAASGVSPLADSGKATRSLTWTGINVEGGFSYEMNVIVDRQRDDRVTAAAPAGGALQRACSNGELLESDETDVMLTGLEVTLTRVQPYTGYLLCLRMKNNLGATNWVVPASNAEHYTAPGPAPRPTKNPTRSVDDRDTANEMFVWNVSSRANLNVPRGDGTFAEHYTVKVIEHPDRIDDDDDDTVHNNRVTRPTAATCGNDFTSSPYAAVTNTEALSPDGFTLAATVARPTTEVRIGGTDATPTMGIISKIVSVCIQAKHGTRVGPWSISGIEVVERQREQN